MKPRLVFALFGAALSVWSPAAAQPKEPVARVDVSGTIGWLLVDKDGEAYANHWHSSLYGGFGGGYYWTDHLKTEIDFGVGEEAGSYGSRRFEFNGLPGFIGVESRFSRRTAGIGQHYQFFRNQWFHPHIGAGVLVVWEEIEDKLDPAIVYESNRPSRVVAPARIEPRRTEQSAKAFVTSGFKGYLNQRTFFRMDVRVAFDKGVDETLLRIGFGVDF
jgi:outer membrane protein W